MFFQTVVTLSVSLRHSLALQLIMIATKYALQDTLCILIVQVTEEEDSLEIISSIIVLL